jgi:hypothetical protein
MGCNYGEDEFDLVTVRVPCMTPKCPNTIAIDIERGKPVPRGLRKLCHRCIRKRTVGDETSMQNFGKG